MSNNEEIKWLHSQLPELVSKEIISESTAEKIRSITALPKNLRSTSG